MSETMKNENKFSYSYSAPRQEEINRIRDKYLPKEQQTEQNKLEQLRRLDASCESAAQIAGLVLGVVGTLVFGLSMCCFLVWESYILGALIAVVGVPMMVLAKPAYDRVLEKKRAQAAPEILRLSHELEQGE